MNSDPKKDSLGLEITTRIIILIHIVGAIFILLFYTEVYARSVRVHGYFRKDGTYVSPHHRSAPDGNFNNNWSTAGNFNPYTGDEGKLRVPPTRSGSIMPIIPLGNNLPYSSGHIEQKNSAMPDLAVPAVTTPLPSYSQPPTPIPLPTPKLEVGILPKANSVISTPRESDIRKPYNDAPNMEISHPIEVQPALSFTELQKIQDTERAKFWATRGYNFNPEYMSAFSMDQKVQDIERAAYWKERGHNFNPEYMSAFSMDQKVQDIERALFWKSKGYNFDPEYMSAFSMDEKVKDIERAKYWKKRGLTFNPDYMSAFSMDREAEVQLRNSQ